MSAVIDTDSADTAYRGLYMIGGAAALIAAAGLVISIVMLWSTVFSRAIAYVGIMASLTFRDALRATIKSPAR